MKKTTLLMQAFDEPNHTQTPNRLFEIMSEMGDAELRVTLVMVRQSLGYHRQDFRMGISKLAAAAGLSEQGARNGAQAAQARGIFRRVNPESQKEAEWELILRPLNHVDPPAGLPLPSTTLTPTLNHVDHITGVKENIKENIKGRPEKRGDVMDGILYFEQQAKDTGADEVEQIIQTLEKGLRVNIVRSLTNQSVARRILKDGRSVETWLAWLKSDEWRLAHLYIYADLEKVWRDFPQAFGADESNNPQGLEIGL
jgi:hypothetical protein